MKYFTPDISELYVGYECEWKMLEVKGHRFGDSSVYDWNKRVLTLEDFSDHDLNSITHNVTSEECIWRTKYLDEKDILDLGFKQVDNFKFILTKGYYDEEDDDTGFVYQLIISPTNTLIFIEKFPINFGKAVRSCYEGNCDTVFNGICKSKNELKTILKFLNVN